MRSCSISQQRGMEAPISGHQTEAGTLKNLQQSSRCSTVSLKAFKMHCHHHQHHHGACQ